MTNIIVYNRLEIHRTKVASVGRYSWLLFLLPLCFACKSKENLDPEVEKLGRATGPVEPSASAPDMGATVVPSKIHRGMVAETMDASRYTYLKITIGPGRQLWAAIPKTEIRKGQFVEVAESIVMKDFKSPTLNRTFPSIVFGMLNSSPVDGGIDEPDGSIDLPPNHPPV